MSEPIKKIGKKPESYSPKDKPEILCMMEELCMEKVLDTIVVEDVEFTIIKKMKTFYAGSYFVAVDLKSEPDVGASWQFYHDNKQRIVDSHTPDCMICISINYAVPSLPSAMLHGQETTNANQPEGIHVFEAPPSLFIKVKATDEAWTLTKKIIGLDNPQWHMSPLFGLIHRVFCNDQFGYEFNPNGNHEMEYYYDHGNNAVAVPVKRRGTNP